MVIDYSKMQGALDSMKGTEEKVYNLMVKLNQVFYSPNHSAAKCNSVISQLGSIYSQVISLAEITVTYTNTIANEETALASGKSEFPMCYNRVTYDMQPQMPDSSKSYLERTVNSIILGEFSNDTTLLGASANILLSFTGVDAAMDARDFVASAKKGDLPGMVLNALSFIPILGAIPEAVKIARHADDVSDVAKNLSKVGKSADEVNDVLKNSTYSWKIGAIEDAKYLGKGKVGDFSNLEGTTVEDILSRIPSNATRRELTSVPGKVTEGFEYKWYQDGKRWRVRVHGVDASAPKGSNAANGWIVRVQRGDSYFDPNSLQFQPQGISNVNSPHYSEEMVNATHIPIVTPKK